MAQQTTIISHDKKPGDIYIKGGKKYFRSIIGRNCSGFWLPYMYKPIKGGWEPTPMTPEETMAVLKATDKISSKELTDVRVALAKHKRREIKRVGKEIKARRKKK